jgi:hypothetical protein
MSKRIGEVGLVQRVPTGDAEEYQGSGIDRTCEMAEGG